MGITKLSIKRPIATIMVLLIVLVFGLISLVNIPMEQMPEIEVPVITVAVPYPGATPEEVDALVTEPLENSLKSLNNLKDISSVSKENLSQITLSFTDGTDIDNMMIDVMNKTEAAYKGLPEDVSDPTYFQFSTNMIPTVSLGISGNMELSEVDRVVKNQVVPALEKVDGVGQVQIIGGVENQVKVILDAEKMEKYGIIITDVTNALSANNNSYPIGQVDRGETVINLRSGSKFTDIEDINNTLVKSAVYGDTLAIKEFAKVGYGAKDSNSFVFQDDQPAVGLYVYQQSTANTVDVAQGVITELDILQSKNDDLTYDVYYNGGESIETSINTVAQSAILGAIIAGFVVLLFLGSFRDTMSVVLSIPVSIIFAFGFMALSGTTLNMVSLGGLTLGVGMLVDNSIVVLENIYRKKSLGDTADDAALFGTKEVTSAITASTLTTMAVFAPMLIVTTGTTAAITHDLAITVIFSLLASLIVALTVIPMIMSRALRYEGKQSKVMKATSGKWNQFFDWLKKEYGKVIEHALKHKFLTIGCAIGLFILSLGLATTLGVEMIPSSDMGMYMVNLSYPEHYDEDKMLADTQNVESEIRTIPEVESLSTVVETNGKSSITVNVGSAATRDKSIDEIMEETRALLWDEAAAEVKVVSMGDMSSAMSSTGTVTVRVFGDDLETLEGIANDITDLLKNDGDFYEVENSFSQGMPQGNITIDEDKAAVYGLTPSTITGILYSSVNGAMPTSFMHNNQNYDVNVTYSDAYIGDMQKVMNINIPTSKGFVPLYEFATIEVVPGVSQIDRENSEQYVQITAGTNLDSKSANDEINALLADYYFPADYSYDLGGSSENMQEEFMGLVYSLILGILIVYMVMAAQFESYLEPFIIIMTVPLAITGSLIGLFITGKMLSIVACIGFIILIGIVVNNAIVLVDYINRLRREEDYEMNDAIITAGKTRLRPILMTSLTTILAMTPMALEIGEGSETMSPMAIAVAFGLAFATLLTLIVIPVVYSIFESAKDRRKAKKEAKKAVKESKK